MTHCRIGKVTYKQSGLSVLTPRPRGLPAHEVDAITKSVGTIAGFWPGDMAGMVVVGWSMDGYFSRCTRIHNSSPVGQTLMPSFVAEILRRDISAEVCREVLGGEY